MSLEFAVSLIITFAAIVMSALVADLARKLRLMRADLEARLARAYEDGRADERGEADELRRHAQMVGSCARDRRRTGQARCPGCPSQNPDACMYSRIGDQLAADAVPFIFARRPRRGQVTWGRPATKGGDDAS